MKATCPVRHDSVNQARRDLPAMPPRIGRLPVDERGYPIPWFVSWIDGKPEFRVADGQKLVRAIKEKLCWVCGEPMGRFNTFVIGPMCALNRVSSEPPSHFDCAVFSAMACPMLVNPNMHRREKGLPPEEDIQKSGVFIKRNPGVTLLWTTLEYRPFIVQGQEGAGDGILLNLGQPEHLHWFKEGRRAIREEVIDAIESGLPALRELAEKDGPAAVADLGIRRQFVLDHLLPDA